MSKKFLSIILAFVMVLSLSVPAFAAENVSNTSPQRIPYSELPDEYKQVISSDAVIFQNADGSYDIFQNEPVLSPAKARATNKVCTQWRLLY